MGMGGLSCGASFLKYLLFIFNFVFFVCGAAIFSVAMYVKFDAHASEYLNLATNASDNASIDSAIWLLVAVGVFILLVGFLGCCGACNESSWMLCLYAGLLVLIFILQIAGAVLAVIYKDQIENGLKEALAKDVNEYYINDNNDATTKTWNYLQFTGKCCGSNNFTDYVNSNYSDTAPFNAVPPSCCKQSASGTAEVPAAANFATCKAEAAEGYSGAYTQLNNQGCYDSVLSVLMGQSTILIGVGFGLAFIQILGIVFACCVRSEING